MILTKRQKQLYDYIDAFIARHGYAPTLEDYVLPQTADIVTVARRLAAY
jgi:SOS-response transcriptional repressor LexA